MYHIYLIEDDENIRFELSGLLCRYGYTCTAETEFETIAQNAAASGCDLILLDINLPRYDGFYVCREIRKASAVPIIMVTSRDNDADELMSINLGADDYITKPYNPQILLARIESLLKRANSGNTGLSFTHNGLSLDMAAGTASFCGSTEELTKNEIRILHMLMQNAGVIVSRNDLIDALWQTDEFIDDNTLTVNINRLRAKLAGLGAEGYIKTRRGQGYSV
ncbi:MAG TPA: DNA-binding response regulator [Clostridiales bacterium]|nr:DNA-binding response regulator [Clostridiales bacterium]